MTKPTIFANNRFASEHLVPRNTDGGDKLFDTTLNVPSGTVNPSVFGMLRMFKGDRIQIIGSNNDILDSGASTVYSVGYAYDDNAVSGADDDNAFIDAQSAQVAGSIGASSLLKGGFGFLAAGDGYVTLSILGGNTDTAGDIIIAGITGR